MSKVEQLERDMRSLTHSDLEKLRKWFETYIADEWDKRIEADVKAGRLNHLGRKALAEHKAGKTKPL